MMRVLDLFSGIGGFSLGLERAGFETVAFCEIDPFCKRVLAKHWPKVPIYDDVRELTGQRLRADGIAVDLICGGFPCQDISVAGKGGGITAERSGLWSEYARIIGELRPRYVIVENVAALLGRGLDRVLGDLAAFGFDAEWHCIPASAVGAPHIRDRVWIVAYARRDELRHEQQRLPGRRPRGVRHEGQAEPRDDGAPGNVADAASDRRDQQRRESDIKGGEGQRRNQSGDSREDLALGSGARLAVGPRTLREWAHAATTGNGWWATESDVGRVVARPAERVDRRKRLIALGNGLVPQIPELIGRAILQMEEPAK